MFTYKEGSLRSTDGTKLFYRQWEPEDPKAVLLFVHGVGEHSGRYLHAREYFAQVEMLRITDEALTARRAFLSQPDSFSLGGLRLGNKVSSASGLPHPPTEKRPRYCRDLHRITECSSMSWPVPQATTSTT